MVRVHTHTHSGDLQHPLCFSFERSGLKLTGIKLGNPEIIVGQDRSVGIVTHYGLDGPGIESRREGKTFRTRPDWPWGPPSLLYNGYGAFPRGKVAGPPTSGPSGLF